MKLSRRVGRDISVPEAETREIKTALARLGLYEIPSYGLTPYPDEAMFHGIAALQTRLGLEATGSMLPRGIEELVIGDALTKGRASDESTAPSTIHVRSYKQNRHGEEVEVAEHDRSAPNGRRQPSTAPPRNDRNSTSPLRTEKSVSATSGAMESSVPTGTKVVHIWAWTSQFSPASLSKVPFPEKSSMPEIRSMETRQRRNFRRKRDIHLSPCRQMRDML